LNIIFGSIVCGPRLGPSREGALATWRVWAEPSHPDLRAYGAKRRLARLSVTLKQGWHHMNFSVAAIGLVRYKYVVLIHLPPLAERLAIMRAAPMPDAACGAFAAALHALIAACLARLLDLVLLWQSGQLPSPPVRPAPQPRHCTRRARNHSSAPRPNARRRSRVRDAAPRGVLAACVHPSAAHPSYALTARPAPPGHRATGEARLSPAARAPPSNAGFLCRNRPERAEHPFILNVTLSKHLICHRIR